MGKESPQNAADTGDMLPSLCQEDLLEKEMANTLILAREISGTEGNPDMTRPWGPVPELTTDTQDHTCLDIFLN